MANEGKVKKYGVGNYGVKYNAFTLSEGIVEGEQDFTVIIDGVTYDIDANRQGTPIVKDIDGEVIAKVCSKCFEMKLRSDTALKAFNTDGLDSFCKLCSVKRTTDYLEDKPFLVLTATANLKSKSCGSQMILESKKVEELCNSIGRACELTGVENPSMEHIVSFGVDNNANHLGNIALIDFRINHAKRTNSILQFFVTRGQEFGVTRERFEALIRRLADANNMDAVSYLVGICMKQLSYHERKIDEKKDSANHVTANHTTKLSFHLNMLEELRTLQSDNNDDFMSVIHCVGEYGVDNDFDCDCSEHYNAGGESND